MTNTSKKKLNTLANKILSVVVTFAFVSSMCPGLAIAASVDKNEELQTEPIVETEDALGAKVEAQSDDVVVGDESDGVSDTDESTGEFGESASEPEGEEEELVAPEEETVYAEFNSNGMYCANLLLDILDFNTDAYPALLSEDGADITDIAPESCFDEAYLFLTAVEQVSVQTDAPSAGNKLEEDGNNKELTKVRYCDGEWQGYNGNEWFTITPSSVTFYYYANISRDEQGGSFTLDIATVNWPYTKAKWLNPHNGKYDEAKAAKYDAIPDKEYQTMYDPGVVVYQLYDEDGNILDGFNPVYTYYWGCTSNKTGNKLSVKSESSTYGIDEIRIQSIGRVNVVKNQAYVYDSTASFDDVENIGERIDVNDFFTIPFGDINEGRYPHINAMLVAVKVYHLVDAEYTVKHVVDGVEMEDDTDIVTEQVRKTDGTAMIDVVASSVAPKEYKGYKYDGISTDDTFVESGTVITLTYVPDYDQVKKTSYTVKHVVDGVEMADDEKSYTGSAWVNEKNPMIAIEDGSLEPNEYEGYEFAGIDVADDVESVADGSVITLTYKPVEEEVVTPPAIIDPDDGDDPVDEPANEPVDEPANEPEGDENIAPIIPIPGGSDGGIIIPDNSAPFTFPSVTFPPLTFPAVSFNTPTVSDTTAAEETILPDEVPQTAPEMLIADDDVPLVAFDEEHGVECWVHWLMIAGMIVTVIYGVGVVARRRHLTNALSELEDDVLGRGSNDAYKSPANTMPQMA